MSSLHPVDGTAAEILALLREWDATDDPPPLVVETSGSTGTPKRVLLSRAALRASVKTTTTTTDSAAALTRIPASTPTGALSASTGTMK